MSRKTWAVAAVCATIAVGIPLILWVNSQVSNWQATPVGEPPASFVMAVATGDTFLPLIVNPPATPTPLPTSIATSTPSAGPTVPPTNASIIESFEGAETSWVVTRETSGSAALTRSNVRAKDGTNSALSTTSSSGSRALVRVNFNEPARTWGERPGTWFWQQASVYLPSATVSQLGSNNYLTLGGLWPSTGGSFGWWLRLRQGGKLYVYGYTKDGVAKEFQVYGTIPQDQWFELTLGLHSQNGPGVKRAFAFLINGDFYGWYHQGNMQSETYNRAAVGILDTNSTASLQVFVDGWRSATTGQFPPGPDNRSTANVQEQDFRTQRGVQWQIDWSTWEMDLRMHPTFGLYSAANRLQSGRNIDRMPGLVSGWAEIEIDWPAGTPPASPTSWFGPMVGFRKEISREENMEIIPVGRGGGAVDLVLEAWVNGGPVELAHWPLPQASALNSHIPEPGDIIRVRWEQINATQLNVRASYYDASANSWKTNAINVTTNNSNVGGINFNDGFHLASSITIDSHYYSIRRYKVGTLPTYPN